MDIPEHEFNSDIRFSLFLSALFILHENKQKITCCASGHDFELNEFQVTIKMKLMKKKNR